MTSPNQSALPVTRDNSLEAIRTTVVLIRLMAIKIQTPRPLALARDKLFKILPLSVNCPINVSVYSAYINSNDVGFRLQAIPKPIQILVVPVDVIVIGD